ncbi:MAG TPA: ABC transporter permease [Longimicrobiales bacterium]
MRTESFAEGVQLAVDQLRANKFRSTLTILGIVIGVATVMAMSALITGLRESILEGIEAAGPKNFIVARFNFNDVQFVSDGGRPPWADNEPLTVAEIQGIAELDRVRTAIVDASLSADISVGSQRVSAVQISATSVGWRDYSQGDIVAGHDFLPADVRASRTVTVLSAGLAEALFGRLDPIGRTVRIRGVPYRVIGIFEPAENIFTSAVEHFAVVPYTSAFKHLDQDEEWVSALVVTADHATQAEAIDEVITFLRVSRGLRPAEPNDFAIIRQEEMVRTFNRITGVFFIVMLVLSSVGLMVGGVGVIGIMMIAVTERTREIGIRKAVGATRGEILWQFLVESATVTLIGGAIGMLLGGGAAVVVDALTPVPASVPLWAVAAALAMAAGAGILFGLWPAWRAARMDPVVALRFE